MSTSIQSIFSKNRTEELGKDVWAQFVIPRFFDKLDFYGARKPRIIVGGRGCGKTMLLRYLSHHTMFSPDRPTIPADAINHIGLYWRADTHFLNLMVGRGVPEDVWHAAFIHMAAISLGIEVLESLRSIVECSSEIFRSINLNALDFSRLSAFDNSLPKHYLDLISSFEEKLWEMQAWVNDIRKKKEPTFLPGEKFVSALLSEVKSQIPELSPAIFFVYIDEYENLHEFQQKIVNTWLKHSESPLIFNLAMRKNALETSNTTGSESLSDIHDYRTHDLEDYLRDEFQIFAAEILLSKLLLANQSSPVDLAVLRDSSKLNLRRSSEYIARVNDAAKKLLPSISYQEMANLLINDTALLNTLRNKIKQALLARGSKASPDTFIRKDFPEASIVVPALIYRSSIEIKVIVNELNNLEKGEPNSFTGKRGWIHNNFVGTYLQIYEPYSRACPFYAGFQTFCQLAHANLRYFLELCNKSIIRIEEPKPDLSIPIDIQAEAARQASSDFLREVKSYGPKGLQLHTFVLRLGSLFAIAQQRPTQSEPEQTHFSVGSGKVSLTFEDMRFLREAVKRSVLYEEEETKKKDSSDPEDIEYVLAPIYSPYFHISYRKKRKLKLKPEECSILIRGNYDQARALINEYSRKWQIDRSGLSPTLFSHLDQDL